VGRRKKPYKLLCAQAGAENVIEHDCMACGESWDVYKDEGAMELCYYCGSNDIHTRPAPTEYWVHMFKEPKHPVGPDIYDQYQVYT
jgi:predicted  nucleic acid-binding Zn-ribbon protein